MFTKSNVRKLRYQTGKFEAHGPFGRKAVFPAPFGLPKSCKIPTYSMKLELRFPRSFQDSMKDAIVSQPNV